jgi:putative flippase GtrA
MTVIAMTLIGLFGYWFFTAPIHVQQMLSPYIAISILMLVGYWVSRLIIKLAQNVDKHLQEPSKRKSWGN